MLSCDIFWSKLFNVLTRFRDTCQGHFAVHAGMWCGFGISQCIPVCFVCLRASLGMHSWVVTGGGCRERERGRRKRKGGDGYCYVQGFKCMLTKKT